MELLEAFWGAAMLFLAIMLAFGLIAVAVLLILDRHT